MTAPFPTRKQEEWRYADLDALKPIWSALAPPQRFEIAAQQKLQQIWLPDSEVVQVRRAEIAISEGGSVQLFVLNTASEYGRVEIDVTLASDAEFELNAANIGGGFCNLEIVTTVHHIGERGQSRQTVRSVLGGKAVGTYLGKVEVARGAQKTDAGQSVKAMLLDRGATANCKPELEIFADDVKCAHGAAVGELDAAQMFYAMSRGLPPADARALLLEGFVMGLWDEAPDGDVIRDASRAALRAIA